MSDIDRYQYGYDLNSNRTYKANAVAHAAGVYLDETYAYDNLNRLTGMRRGNLSGGSIAGTPAREMDYTLDPTGNWSAYLTKTNGSTDLSQNRSSNAVNEITAFTGTPLWSTPPSYDAAGNMTVFPQPATPGSSYTATYDAWNRMVGLTNTSGGSAVATYQYDGRGRRVVKTTPTETRHFYYTNSWQDVEERVGTAATMDKQYVWGVRYVDELVCRDDADNAALPRLYATQDANFNLMRVCNASGGAVVERYVFDPYGTRTVMNASWGSLTASVCQWVLGHQGLIQDAESGLIDNRMRMLHPTVGSFAGRDPSSLLADLDLVLYENDSPTNFVDPSGLDYGFPPHLLPLDYRKTKSPYQYLDYLIQLMGGKLTDEDKASLAQGCVGLCSVYQGLGQPRPENADNTTCFKTLKDALAYNSADPNGPCGCTAHPFYFGKQGHWSKGEPTPDPKAQNSVPNDSIGDKNWVIDNAKNTANFNYVIYFPETKTFAGMNHGAQIPDRQGIIKHAAPPSGGREYPNEIWCVTCLTNYDDGT